ncbi:hypothetical protein BG003_006488 [Podila horticola]|nr:hypothetical protein BG003_006488 [Podila horticola]
MSEKELLAQIAQVAGAINKHMNTPPAPYYNSGYAPARGGYNARGRGRGMPYSSYTPVHNPVHTPPGAFNRKLTLNNTQLSAPSPTQPPVAARNLSLVNNSNINKTGESSTASSPASAAVSPSVSSSSAPPTPPVTPVPTPIGQWIQTKTKNMSMMNPSTYQKTMVAKQNSIRSAKVAKLKMHQERAKKAADLRKGIVRVGDKVYSKSLDGRKLVMRDPNQGDIVINGATFQMDPRGNRLIRKIGTESPASGNGATCIATTATITNRTFGSSGATPKQFAVDGVVYVRTTNGNLVRATLVKSQLLAKRAAQEALKAKRNKSMARKRQFCKYFTRFGQCTNTRCPFMHSRQHLAICKRFLRGQCHFTDASCKLSHTPSPHTTPACSHFQYAACTKDKCLYPHIKVNAQAPICRPFAKEGWCETGATCKDRHVWICPDFDTPAGCKVKCGLAHVANGGIKVKKTAEEIERDRQNGIVRHKKNGSGPGSSSAWSGRYMDRPTPDSPPKDTAKVREYDENFIPLDFDSADEDEGAMLQMQVDSHESAEEEDADVEEEDVNSDVEMEDEDEEEREEEMGEEREGEEDEDEEESDGDQGFAAFEDDEDGFYR